jgi:NAD-dependent dihydropyrimidine dehydrogenase PreA subunit
VRQDGLFIAIDVDDGIASDAELARALTEACPVDIFTQRDDGGVGLAQENLDECVLCRLCLDASPAGAVKVIKLYDQEAVLA